MDEAMAVVVVVYGARDVDASQRTNSVQKPNEVEFFPTSAVAEGSTGSQKFSPEPNFLNSTR